MVHSIPSDLSPSIFCGERVKYLFLAGNKEIKGRIFPIIDFFILPIFDFSKGKNSSKNSSEAVAPLKLKLKKVILR
jgi:hypothetical protein